MSATPPVPNAIGEDKFPFLSNVETGITATASGNQTTAYQLTAQSNIVSTVASGNDSVKLPKINQTPGALGSVGTIIFVGNAAASNSMQVYGASPDTINAVATGTGVAVAAGVNVWFVATGYTLSTNVGTWRMTNSQAAAVAAITSGTISGVTIDNSVIGGITPAAGTFTTGTFNAIAGGDSSLGIAGQAAAQGGAVALVGGTSSTSGNAGGAVTAVGGTPGATGVGGAVTLTGAAGGATSGAGGAVSMTGGAGTAGNAIGGAASVTAGAGQGTAAGGAASITGGASGAGATGNGGACTQTGGAALSTNGTGGAAGMVGGAGSGSGAGGAITITSGAAGATGVAGAVNISVGAATAGNGSAVTITGGNGAGGTASGGNVNLVPGTAVSTGTPGEVQVNGTSGMFEAGWQQFVAANVPVTGTSYTFFMANRAYRVKAASVICSSAGTTPTVDITKDTGTTAPGAGSSVLTGAISFSGTANTRVAGTVSSTIATITLAAGDRLAAKWGGTVGSLTGGMVSVLLVPA